MFYQIPPAGNPVVLSPRCGPSLADLFPGYQFNLYSSGTAALAASVKAALALRKDNADSSRRLHEIIMPAYACPDLVSAVLHTGAKPVPVDLERDRTWFHLDALESAITPRTAAIIGVNLFGIGERWTALQKMARQAGVVLIEDSAQYLPGSEEDHQWHGDMVVLSFGRGKPVSLLGGGVVLCKVPELAAQLPTPAASVPASRFMYMLKGVAYNMMISPYVFWLPQSLPFLHLGETRFHPLENVEAMDDIRKQLLPGNLARYREDRQADRCQWISRMLSSLENIVDLPKKCGQPASRRLLRYPFLVPAAKRDNAFENLRRAGLGVSKMYPADLPNIDGLEGLVAAKDYPGASDFASRILTLPTHPVVKKMHVQHMGELLRAALT